MKRSALDIQTLGLEAYARDCYIHPETFKCATRFKCIPCFYKLFPTGTEELPPNQRPELCHRSKKEVKVPDKSIGLYSKGSKLLTVGDGDFSFSLSLVQVVDGVTATSYEPEEVLRTTYPNIESTLFDLSQLSEKVYFNVDATDLQNSLPAAIYHSYFDVVIWNFPCVAIERGKDGQVNEIERNVKLLESFLRCVVPYLKPAGEIHITHKTFEPFSWWNLAHIAIEQGWEYRGSVIFDKYLYPLYTNRKALDKKSFPIHDAEVYLHIMLSV